MREQLKQRMLDTGLVLSGSFRLASGETSSIYFSIKNVLGYPDILSDVCDELYRRLEPGVTCVAGAGHGGIILASGLSVKYRLKAAYIRAEPKGHGPRAQIEGYRPTADDFTAVVEDVVTTGGSTRKVISLLEPITRIEGVHAVISRGDAGFDRKFDYLFDAKEFIEVRQ